MKNPTLTGKVNRFAKEKRIEAEFWEKYQYFANYLLLKDIYYRVNEEYPYESQIDTEFLEDINFGKNNSMAVDGCFFIYKKEILHLNLDDEDLDNKFGKMTDAVLHIVLIQTKSGALAPDELSTLSNCFATEFKGQEEWSKLIKFKGKCEKLMSENDKISFKFWCFYVTGKPIDVNTFKNETFLVRQDALKQSMRNFLWLRREDDVIIDYIDDNKMLDIITEQEENVQTINRTVNYAEITDEIEVATVGKILFGAITFGELMKIIYDKEKGRRNDLYGFNVRDEVEKSLVRIGIINTIKNNGDNFILLNNGITIVVDRQEKRGKRGIILENIRIINGCQTCNAILDTCKDTTQYDDLRVSIKIIETRQDNLLLGSITYSSNHQNPVTKENLLSIHPKMFQLETNYKEFELTNSTQLQVCLFERREGQYRGSSVHYIDMLAQAKAYISLWEKNPHIAVAYRDEVLEFFTKERDEDPNFLNKSMFAGVLWHNIYKEIPTLYKNARYQIFSAIILYQIEQIYDCQEVLLNNEFKNVTQIIDLTTLSKLNINIPTEVNLVIEAIKTCLNENGDLAFPPSNRKGKIHYRKFYPSNAIRYIFKKYKEIKAPVIETV